MIAEQEIVNLATKLEDDEWIEMFNKNEISSNELALMILEFVKKENVKTVK